MKTGAKLTSSKRQVAERCRAAVQALLPDARVIVYGSCARGEEGPGSDLDLLILTQGSVSLAQEDEVFAALYRIELDTGVPIVPVIHEQAQWQSPRYQATPLARNIAREGILL